MKKILFITNHSYMLYRFRLELTQTLMKNHEVVLSMPFVGHEEDFQALGLKCIKTDVDRRGINPKTDLKLFFQYRKLLKQEKPDLVITYSIKPNIYAGLACSMAGIPYCANVQGLGTAFQRKGLAKFVTMLYKTAFRKVRTVFFENEGNAQEFIDRNIIPKERITVLPGAGINLEAYQKQPYPDNDAVRFLYLGRIMQEKGIDELFAAMRRLHGELGDRVVLDLVGFFDDDYYKEQVDQLVADGIAVFHGFQTEPRPYYAAADCVVLPSYHEGLSNVLLEAAATGRPVITSDIHGCKEAVDADVSGLLCTVKDADSLYQQMLRMAQMSKAERQAMGDAGYTKMEREFEKTLVVQKTTDAIFESVRV
jgi:galacturonosyltransferase